MYHLLTQANSPPPASWQVCQNKAQGNVTALAQVPWPPEPHLPRKSMVPSARVPPMNTTRAIRVPLLADFPVSMLLPVSASIGRDVEATQEESRFLWFGGWSQESVRRWHPRLSCSSTNGQLTNFPSGNLPSPPFLKQCFTNKVKETQNIGCLGSPPDQTKQTVVALSWCSPPSKVPLNRLFGRLFSQAFRVYMFYYVAEQMF